MSPPLVPVGFAVYVNEVRPRWPHGRWVRFEDREKAKKETAPAAPGAGVRKPPEDEIAMGGTSAGPSGGAQVTRVPTATSPQLVHSFCCTAVEVRSWPNAADLDVQEVVSSLRDSGRDTNILREELRPR
jgi:hypothetical protein